MDCIVHVVAKSRARLNDFHFYLYATYPFVVCLKNMSYFINILVLDI